MKESIYLFRRLGHSAVYTSLTYHEFFNQIYSNMREQDKELTLLKELLIDELCGQYEENYPGVLDIEVGNGELAMYYLEKIVDSELDKLEM